MISANYTGKTSSDEDDDDDEQGSRSVQTQSLSFSVEALMSKKSTSHEPMQMPFMINAEDRSVDFPKHRESVKEDSSWTNKPTLSPRKLPYSLLHGRLTNNESMFECHHAVLDVKLRGICKP